MRRCFSQRRVLQSRFIQARPLRYCSSHSRSHSSLRIPPPPHTRKKFQSGGILLGASYSSYYAVFLVLACGSAIAFDFYIQSSSAAPEESPPKPKTTVELKSDDDGHVPDYSKMPTPPGYLGNLTAEQEQKLREMWVVMLKTWNVTDENTSRPRAVTSNAKTSAEITPHASDTESSKTPKKSKRISLFGRKHDDTETSTGASADEDDKYGQTAELQRILASTSPETLRAAYWSMLKSDHPDALLLRFLRARKWNVDRALAMMVSTMNWRSQEMHVDDDVMLNGEGGAQADESSSDATAKKEGHDFLAQLRMGKSFLHGTDKEGRPLTYVRARLHRGGEQTERSLERYTVFTIETARLSLRPPVETACIIFDMTGFTMANMDYTPVKFMIKIFEANYPESLGAILVHKAPWLFQGIWKVIRGWLDPVVAAKVNFTNSVEDMEAFIPRSQIIRELGGDTDWEYKYIEPQPGENDAMKDTATRDKLLEERKVDVKTYEQKTFDWIAAGAGSAESTALKGERNTIAQNLNANYWRLDPYVRARSIYDRVGFLQPGGKVDFFPTNELKSMTLNGGASSSSIPATQHGASEVD